MGSLFFSDLAPHVVNQKHIQRRHIRALQIITTILKIQFFKAHFKHKPLIVALRLWKE